MIYFPEHIRKSVGGFKDSVISLFKTNTSKQRLYEREREKKLNKSKTQKQAQDRIISLFKTNTSKQTVYGRGKKLNKSKTQKQAKEDKINR